MRTGKNYVVIDYFQKVWELNAADFIKSVKVTGFVKNAKSFGN